MLKKTFPLLLATILLLALAGCNASDKKDLLSVTDTETDVTLALEDKKADVEARLGAPETGYTETDDAMETATYFDEQVTLFYSLDSLLRDINIEPATGRFQYRGMDFPMTLDELETLFKYEDADKIDGQTYVYYYNEYDESGKETEEGGPGYRVTVRTRVDDTAGDAAEEVEALIIASY